MRMTIAPLSVPISILSWADWERAVRAAWDGDEMLEDEEPPRERDSNSSVQPQYEDSVLPDRDREHERES